jgi:hypothetical protein
VSLAVTAILAAACGSDDGVDFGPPRDAATQATPAAASPTASWEPAKQPTEFRVAFINLMSPLGVDANDAVADQTYDLRLNAIIEELKAFGPDLVGFNEASITNAHGSAAARLAKELKMEVQYVRANPWFPGQTKEQSDAIAKSIGFEEGEVLLSSGKYPILRWERRALNPLTSETGEGRAALHAVIKGPSTLGEMDVYITHLTGGGDKVRQAQAADFVSFVESSRGNKGPVIVMGGMSDPVGSPTYTVYSAVGLHDVAGKTPVGTCCRDNIIGVQPPLTARTDYLLTEDWRPLSYQLFGDKPHAMPDGTPFYPSDHNGLMAVFPIPVPPEPAP